MSKDPDKIATSETRAEFRGRLQDIQSYVKLVFFIVLVSTGCNWCGMAVFDHNLLKIEQRCGK